MAADANRETVAAFLHDEAAMLDAQRFGDWLDLFAEDGVYWIPSLPDQTDPLGQASIVYEDRTVLRMRVRRLEHPRAWSLQPLPRSSHMLGPVRLTGSAEAPVATGPIQVTLYRDGETLRFDGRQTMTLMSSGDTYRIRQKRLDLINCDGVHRVIGVPL